MIKRTNYEIKMTYINEVLEIDPIEVTNGLMSQIESAGTIYNKSDIMQVNYNSYTFYTINMIFSEGREKTYLKYAIHYNEENDALYYFIYTSKNSTNQELEKILESFKIQ